MNKKIKIVSNGDIKVEASSIYKVTVDDLIFIKEDIYPWVGIYMPDEDNTLIEEMDTEETSMICNETELEAFALNYYFDNVQILTPEEFKKHKEKITQEAPF